MQMNRHNDDCRSPEFMRGMHDFLNVAKANTWNGFMCCPCVLCKNEKDYSCSRILHEHLFTSSFMPNYICWTKHGERGVIMEEHEEEEGDDVCWHFLTQSPSEEFLSPSPVTAPEMPGWYF
jgi:hypothetical protein